MLMIVSQVEENGNGSPSGMDNDSSFRSVGSRQGSPQQEEKNGNVTEESGKIM